MSSETPLSRSIELPDGSVLTLDFNEKFLAKVRQHFELAPDVDVEDRYLKEFFAASLAGV
jgi:hypothetical protein